jgi:hypothetical protein
MLTRRWGQRCQVTVSELKYIGFTPDGIGWMYVIRTCAFDMCITYSRSTFSVPTLIHCNFGVPFVTPCILHSVNLQQFHSPNVHRHEAIKIVRKTKFLTTRLHYKMNSVVIVSAKGAPCKTVTRTVTFVHWCFYRLADFYFEFILRRFADHSICFLKVKLVRIRKECSMKRDNLIEKKEIYIY